MQLEPCQSLGLVNYNATGTWIFFLVSGTNALLGAIFSILSLTGVSVVDFSKRVALAEN